jgi:3-oxoacyl-[acyl-carrier protein] reductase
MLLPHLSAYGESKASLEAASASWARELEGTGVTVNVLVPGGPVDTAFLPDNTTLPRDKLIKPDVMGAPAVWLASAASDGFTNRRLIARQWRADAATLEHALAISFPAAWAGYGPGAAIPSSTR